MSGKPASKNWASSIATSEARSRAHDGRDARRVGHAPCSECDTTPCATVPHGGPVIDGGADERDPAPCDLPPVAGDAAARRSCR